MQTSTIGWLNRTNISPVFYAQMSRDEDPVEKIVQADCRSAIVSVLEGVLINQDLGIDIQ